MLKEETEKVDKLKKMKDDLIAKGIKMTADLENSMDKEAKATALDTAKKAMDIDSEITKEEAIKKEAEDIKAERDSDKLAHKTVFEKEQAAKAEEKKTQDAIKDAENEVKAEQDKEEKKNPKPKEDEEVKAEEEE